MRGTEQTNGTLFSVVSLEERVPKGHPLRKIRALSDDGSLVAGWASQKSMRRKDGDDNDNPDGQGRNASRNFHKEKRSNKTHAPWTDPDAPLARKGGTDSRPSYMGHSLIEHRNGLLVDAGLAQATGYAERETALEMALLAFKITPHVAQNANRPGGSAIDARTTRHGGYRIKRVEETFG